MAFDPQYGDGQYVILIRAKHDTEWTVALDGPFDAYDEAEQFARAECGARWMIAKIESTEGDR